MFGTYRQEDVTLLLKDITGIVDPLPASVREPLIQGGMHYSEMLPLEYVPTEDYMAAYSSALARYAQLTANAVKSVSEKIAMKKGSEVVLVSLARAGISIGVLIKHYMTRFLGICPRHYAISIIRGKGIDRNAMDYILERNKSEAVQFVDGWTGKGAIQNQLNISMLSYPGVDPGLAVLSDPANVAGLSGTRQDFLIASSCLNSTVSGLLSRTYFKDSVIGEGDFHGAAFYHDLLEDDLTYSFINTVESCFENAESIIDADSDLAASGLSEVRSIAFDFGISDINLVKPGIGEATRVLLRRVPWKILVWSLADEEHLGHLYQLAHEKGVAIEQYPLMNYRACGLIKEMADS